MATFRSMWDRYLHTLKYLNASEEPLHPMGLVIGLGGTRDWLEASDNNSHDGPPTWGDCELSVSLIRFVGILCNMLVRRRDKANAWI